MAAAICRPEPMPPAASTGMGRHGVDHLGPQHDAADVAGVAAALAALADDDVDPGVACGCRACLTEPASAATSRPCSCTWAITSSGGVPRALATSFTLSCLRQDVDLGRGGGGRPAQQLALGAAGELGHPVVGQDLLGEVPVALGDHGLQLCLELLGVELAHALVLARDHDVDAVGVVADVLVEPGQLGLELLGAEAHGPEHAEAAGVGDGGHHVAAVGEGEDGELDPQPSTQFVLHQNLLFGGPTAVQRNEN